jgi:hypothetical protein
VVVSFATDGNTEDLGPGYRRRGPISVAQLLEREGFQPASRSRTTRRALTGVAAGAVLALGAVVGSLLLNHGTANTNGDTLASGSQAGGDIVLAQNGQSSSAATAASSGTAQSTTPADQAAPADASNNTAQVVQNGSTGKITINTRTSTATARKATTAPSTTSGGNASSGPATTAPAPSSTPTASSTPTPSPQSSAAPTSTSGNGNTSGATSATPTSANNSLLGTVSGTLTSVTDPVFSWFGGN